MSFARTTRRTVALVAVASGMSAAGAVASVAAPSSGATYRGRTAQGVAIRLGPQRASGRAFRYRARMSCSDGSTFLDDYFTDDVRVRHGHFASRVSSSRGAVITRVTGRVRGTRAGGTIRIVERYSEIPDAHGNTPLAADGAIVCDSHVVRWTATAQVTGPPPRSRASIAAVRTLRLPT